MEYVPRMSKPLAFPQARTPRGLKLTPTRHYSGPRADETVSLMLSELGLAADPCEIEIDETALVPVVAVQRPDLFAFKRPTVKPYRSLMGAFKARRGLAHSA